MSISKEHISEKLIEGYTKTPPSFKEQAVTKLAIQLCQNVELKKSIIFESEQLLRHKYDTDSSKWDSLIAEQSIDMCERLHLPPALEHLLIVRIRSVALQLFSWNRQQVHHKLTPLFADSLLTPSDWTVEMRLDEKKIAERLVQDERIPVCQRFKIACFHSLEFFIHSLWKQISVQHPEDLYRDDESRLVQMWTRKLAEKIDELTPNEDIFLSHLFQHGVREGSRSTVLFCWGEMHMNLRHQVLIGAAMQAVLMIHIRIRMDINMYLNPFSSPAPYTDILFFLLSQMSDEQRVEFFQQALEDTDHNVLVFLLEWPYMDLFLPTIRKLWKILPEAKYRDLLLTLANNYSDIESHRIRRNGYMDYDYGRFMVELLKKTPDHFKRYVFSNNYHNNTNTIENYKLLHVVIQKGTLEIRNKNIFQRIWKHVRPEEKRSFLRSEIGKSCCCLLVLEENWQLLNALIKECLPEDNIATFQKELLRSKPGIDACLEMLANGDEELFISWLNSGFSSKREIFQFILTMFFKGRRFNLKKFHYIEIEIDFLVKLMKWYAPSKNARRKFKSRFVKIYSKDVCISFIIDSKWQELEEFLTWGFPSERDRNRFKKWFVAEFAIEMCEDLIQERDFQKAEQFLSWCFPSEEAVEQFRQELFFFSGLKLQWNIVAKNTHDLDSLIKWFKLSPEIKRKFKKEFLFRPHPLNFLFAYLLKLKRPSVINKEFLDCMLKETAFFFKWGLADTETAMAFKDASKIYLMNFSFSNDEDRQWVQEKWDTLINDRLYELSIEQQVKKLK